MGEGRRLEARHGYTLGTADEENAQKVHGNCSEQISEDHRNTVLSQKGIK